MASAWFGTTQGLLKRIRAGLACILCGTVFLDCASAGHVIDVEDRVGAMMIVEANTIVDAHAISGIRDAMESTAAKDLDLYLLEAGNWLLDHVSLGMDWSDISGDIRQLYDGLDETGAVSFGAANEIERKFYEQSPGYRGPLPGLSGLYIGPFSDAYKRRVEGWQKYLEGFLNANRSEASIARKRLKELKDTLSISVLVPGYRQTMLAGQQIDNFTNQELSRLRIDLQRYLDLRIRQAANEQQERADAQAAFEWALNEEAMDAWRQLAPEYEIY